MVTTLNIKCPHCEQVSQIFLSTSVCVIVLNCPTCYSPIMYFKKKIFLLNNQQLKKITDDSRNLVASKLIEQLSSAEADDSPTAAAQCAVQQSTPLRTSAAAAHSPGTRIGTHQGGKYISEDDCTNLRISLELCSDSKQFIDSM